MTLRPVRFELWGLTFQAGQLHHKVLAVLMMSGANAGMLLLSAIARNSAGA